MGKRFDMKSIFRCMMEEGYYPKYEKTHILFSIDDNTAVVEYEEDVLSIRIFFSIDEETSVLFILGSNSVMADTKGVKAVVLKDGDTIMFSAEFMCDNIREFRKFFPIALQNISHALDEHKNMMKEILENCVLYKDFYTHNHEDNSSKKFCS